MKPYGINGKEHDMFAFAAGLLIGSLAGVFVTCACKAAGWADRDDDRRDRDD